MCMYWSLPDLVQPQHLPLQGKDFLIDCKQALDRDGVLVLADFLTLKAIAAIQREGEEKRHLAYYTVSKHNVYLQPADPALAPDHPRNREVTSSKGCITTDQIPAESALHALYGAAQFRAFVCAVLGGIVKPGLFPEPSGVVLKSQTPTEGSYTPTVALAD